ncbi:MAG: recombinase RecA [Myxococcales bacterium]|nr:recombinase RecA [Myxococcales bacterium]
MFSKEKKRSIDQAVSGIEKAYGKGSIMRLGENQAQDVPAIPTGSPSLDRALGCGGYPRGRVIEIYGPEASGKTTLTLHAIAETQRAGGVAAFIDAEHALDVHYAKALGVDASQLLVSQPDTGEQALDILEMLVRSNALDLIVVDSVAALVPKAEIEGEMGDQQVGLQARLMSKALRKITGLAHRAETAIMFINQLRMKIGVTYGSPETTTGGHALKYYASMRLDIRRIGALKVGEEVRGNRTRVKVVKNKLAPPFATTELDIRYGEGIDGVGELIDHAVEAGLLEKRGSYYSLDGQSLAQGRERMREVLLADQNLSDRLHGGLKAASPAAKAAEQADAKAA